MKSFFIYVNVLLLIMLASNTSYLRAQQKQDSSICYLPNIRIADAEYAKGNYLDAHEYYRRASRCPDASKFENGKKARLGIAKCLPTVSISGISEIDGHCPTDTVSYKGGRKTYRIIFRNATDWEINLPGRDSSWIKIVEQDHGIGTFTVEFKKNRMPTSRRSENIGIYLKGGVEYASTHFYLFQEGNSSLLVKGTASPSIDVDFRGGKQILDVTSDAEWNFRVKETNSLWLKAEKTKVSGNTHNGGLVIQIMDNTNSPKRTGYVFVDAGEIQCTVSVNQQADPNYDETLWEDKAYMDIKDFVLYNDFDGFLSLGNPLYANNITYLRPRILYEGKALHKQTKIDTIYLKIYENGKLSRNEKISPPGYTTKEANNTIWSDGELNGLTISGWGWESAETYGRGTYLCEVWYKGKMLASKTMELSDANAPKIKKIDFAKTDAEGCTIGEFGNSFDVVDMVYLKPRIHFDNPGPDLRSKRFNMIVTDPDGNKVRSFVICSNGRETTVDSIRYRNMVEQMKSGIDQTAEMIPWKTPLLKNKLGTWKFELYYGTGVKVAETTFILYSKDKYLTIDGKVRSEIPITSYAGCKMMRLETTSRSKKYSVKVKSENRPEVVFVHSPSGDTTRISPAGRYSSANEPARIEMATDSSFVIRWLSLESPKKGFDNERYIITVTNDEGIAEAVFFTPADSAAAFVKRSQKKMPIAVKNEVLEMVYVEGADFVMGSTSESPTQYAPKAHIRHMAGFYMSKYPVTQRLWKSVMGSQPKSGWTRKLGKDDDFVAYNITFEEALAFVGRLNEITGMRFSLPSEEEFEYVFRGGNMTKKWGYDYESCPVYQKSANLKNGYEYINNRTVRLYSKPNVRYTIGDDMTIHVLRLVLHQ